MRRISLAGPLYADEHRSRASALLEAAGTEPVDPTRRGVCEKMGP